MNTLQINVKFTWHHDLSLEGIQASMLVSFSLQLILSVLLFVFQSRTFTKE